MRRGSIVTMSLGIGLVGAAMAGAPATAQTNLIASLQGPIETSYGQAFQELDKCLQEGSDGALSVTIYPDRQLGDLTETFEQVRQGTVDIAAVAPGMMAEFMPEVQVVAIPFLFESLEHWKDVVNGEVGQELAKRTREKVGIEVIGYYGGSVRQLVTTRPINSLADIDGLVMRLLPSDLLQAAWSSLGAKPTNLAYGEVYNALQLGVIQGLDNEPEWIIRMKFHEQAPYVALTSHEIVTRPLIFSAQTMDRLPPEQQELVRACGLKSAIYEQDLESRLDGEYLDSLVGEYGMTTTEIDKKAFAERVAAAVEPFVEENGLVELRQQIETVAGE